VNRHHEDAARPPQQVLRAVPTRRVLEGGCVGHSHEIYTLFEGNAFNRPVTVSPISMRIALIAYSLTNARNDAGAVELIGCVDRSSFHALSTRRLQFNDYHCAYPRDSIQK
jgi:hypothetical protein